ILAPKSPWKITLVKGGVHTKLRERADLLLCANTLNELDWHGGEAIYEQAEHTARSLTLRVNPGGRMLLVEPGVRDAARILSILRQEFLQSGFSPIAPCPHMGDCPMPASGNGPWCHFRFDAASAPQWLKAITLEAKLTKQATSLSFLFLAQDKFLEKGLVRVISESFRVPEGMGQYGCSDHGLTLLGYKYGYAPFNPGDTLRPVWPAEELRDEKSGGLILPVTPNGPKPPVSKRPPATEAEEQRPEERQPERLPPESGAAKATGRDGRRPENKRPKSAQRTRKPREDKGGPGTKRPRKPAPSKGAPKRGK
ncbi:MAG: hypothetical protein KKB70_02240, partial [Proteobacteria bacterium]|nr:hypothetical protein [Pseudomonadota bacterium]MBU1611858.1 hypothetical protein [Pseudomonadota bacterium]